MRRGGAGWEARHTRYPYPFKLPRVGGDLVLSVSATSHRPTNDTSPPPANGEVKREDESCVTTDRGQGLRAGAGGATESRMGQRGWLKAYIVRHRHTRTQHHHHRPACASHPPAPPFHTHPHERGGDGEGLGGGGYRAAWLTQRVEGGWEGRRVAAAVVAATSTQTQSHTHTHRQTTDRRTLHIGRGKRRREK